MNKESALVALEKIYDEIMNAIIYARSEKFSTEKILFFKTYSIIARTQLDVYVEENLESIVEDSNVLKYCAADAVMKVEELVNEEYVE
jgi:hypothetical protein